MFDLAKYETVEEVGTWDWSWTIGALLRRDGELYFAVDSGCSCYSYGDGLDEGDLVKVSSWQEAVELAKKDGSFSDEEVYSFADRLAAR